MTDTPVALRMALRIAGAGEHAGGSPSAFVPKGLVGPLHRSFFRGTVVRGTMALDGVSYVYVPKLWDGPDSFLEGLRDKTRRFGWSIKVESL